MTNLEPLVVTGDLIFLTPEERVRFYVQTCDSMGLDFRTRPLQYFEQVDRNGKRVLILYALRGASVQLSAKHNLSVKMSEATFSHDAVMFMATVRNVEGREDYAVGAGSLKGLEGKEYADAIMAAQTKAKRRGILDFVGSGLLDESEVEGMRGSTVDVTASSEFQDYAKIPQAPAPASSDAPSKEVLSIDNWPIGKTVTITVDGPSISPEITAAVETLTAGIVHGMKPLYQAVSDAQYALAADVLGPDMAKDAPVPVGPYDSYKLTGPTILEERAPAPLGGLTEAEITSRLNSYRRDTLQQGGMRPSKGFGIAAKWSKFLAKVAPAKSLSQYSALIKLLDNIFQNGGGALGVVNYIEKEIA
jgi:hypothetical protein